jgi:hypothetical protein
VAQGAPTGRCPESAKRRRDREEAESVDGVERVQLAADGWSGEVPAGMRLVSAPTGIFMIVGRVQVDGEADLPAVHALQDQFTITPVSVRDGGLDQGQIDGWDERGIAPY